MEKELTTQNELKKMLSTEAIKKRFNDLLGKKSAGFVSSILAIVNNNDLLQKADPNSIISAAAMAASLDLPINPNLGFAYIVPYKDNKIGKIVAQFQAGYKGFIQLALRSGQYKKLNYEIIYEGELVSFDRFKEEYIFDQNAKKSDKVIGYFAYMKLHNGYEKPYYMSIEDAEKHGRKYSKSYDKGLWTKDPNFMGLKTSIKLMLSKWGILSVDMQKAIEADQAVIENNKYNYLDNPQTQTLSLKPEVKSPQRKSAQVTETELPQNNENTDDDVFDF